MKLVLIYLPSSEGMNCLLKQSTCKWFSCSRKSCVLCPGLELNPVNPEIQASVLTTKPTHLAGPQFKSNIANFSSSSLSVECLLSGLHDWGILVQMSFFRWSIEHKLIVVFRVPFFCFGSGPGILTNFRVDSGYPNPKKIWGFEYGYLLGVLKISSLKRLK